MNRISYNILYQKIAQEKRDIVVERHGPASGNATMILHMFIMFSGLHLSKTTLLVLFLAEE